MQTEIKAVALHMILKLEWHYLLKCFGKKRNVKDQGPIKFFFQDWVTQASFKEAGTADSAMDLLIMSAMIGAIVPGSFLIIHVGTGSKPHVLIGDFSIFFRIERFPDKGRPTCVYTHCNGVYYTLNEHDKGIPVPGVFWVLVITMLYVYKYV